MKTSNVNRIAAAVAALRAGVTRDPRTATLGV